MRRSKTNAEFVAEVKALVGDDYLVIGEYKNTMTRVAIKHVICGSTHDMIPNNFLRGATCLACSGRKKKTTEAFKEEVKALVGAEYAVLGEYVNTSTKITFKHSLCSSKYEVRPNDFLRGVRCPSCSGLMKKTSAIFKDEVKCLVGDDYVVLGEYSNSISKLTVEHVTCGYKYKVCPSDFLRGRRCPNCLNSKGEQAITDFLRIQAIENICEFRIPSCRDKNPLPFDFAVIQGNSVTCLIEYDGEQHFKPREHFGGKPAFRDRQRKDAIKTQYCADNGIHLIRIPYWDYDNIDAILTEKLLPLLYNADKHNAS